MEQRKQLRSYIQRAKRSLRLEKSIPLAQYGLFFALLASASIMIISRLFVWPYYRQTAFLAFVACFIVTLIIIWWKRVREQEALFKLDSYFAHNELVTSLSFKNDKEPLVQSLLQKAIRNMEQAFAAFKQREKQLFRPKALIGVIVTVCLLAVMYMFPAKSQMEAIEVEKEQAVIEDIKKEVAQLEKKQSQKK